MTGASNFLASLTLSENYGCMLLRTYENFRRDTINRLGVAPNKVPPSLDTISSH